MGKTVLRKKYAIVGVGYTDQGKVPGRTAASFYVEACANAIKDAGLKRDDIDGLICYRHFMPASGEREVTPYLIAQLLGLTPSYLSQEANCARSHLFHALAVLETGLCKYVIVAYGDNALSNWRIIDENHSDRTVFGQIGYVGEYAMAAQRAMHLFHTGPETWKEIAVGQRMWAQLNPRAFFYGRTLTEERYLNSNWAVEPFRTCDLSLLTDGGRAYIVTSLDRARNLKNRPAVILGIGQHNPSAYFDRSTCMDEGIGAKEASRMALGMAGVALDDVDACEIYDCFTYTVEATLAEYGFFKPGEGLDWFKDGNHIPGGALPVNTSGGQLSEAYYMGLTPLTEAVMQLMGRGGDRQMGPKTNTKEPEIILCSDNGATFQTHCCTILGRY